MMWTVIFYTGRTNLVQVQGTLTAQIYCDVILQPHVHPIMHTNGVIFSQDNARPNTTRQPDSVCPSIRSGLELSVG
jgi:hypothetical protein